MSADYLRTRRPLPGVAVAGVTATISGVSIYVNSFGVHSFSSPAVYTTAKNLVATVGLVAATTLAMVWRHRRSASAMDRFVGAPNFGDDRRLGARQWLGLTYVGVIGGGLAFVLFFNGLAISQPASAAFWRDSLVLWVAILAVVFLRERLRWWNVAAMVLLVAGEIVVTGGVGQLGANRGEMYVVASSLLWAGEVVIARKLLATLAPATLSVVRMGVGAVTLVVYLAATGSLSMLVSLTAHQLTWALWTGTLLAAYVATWMSALARARALDVTSILVASALITWTLQLIAGAVVPAPNSLGLVLIALGAGLLLWAARVGREGSVPRRTSGRSR